MTSYPAPSPPYLGPPAHSSGNSNKPIHRVVIHSTVSPCVEGGARNTAAYFRSPSAGGSAHYVVDPGEDVQAAYDSVVCWHAPPNEHSIGIEMCDEPDPSSAKRWNDTAHQKTLDRTARLTAQLCLAYDIPVTFLSVSDLKAGMHGITTHNNVSQAWHESTHWDPGAWPQDKFMDLVRDHVDEITGGHDHDTLGDDDMPSWKNVQYTKDFTVTADGDWHTLRMDISDDGKDTYYSVLNQEAYATGTVHVTLSGVVKGHEIDLRTVLIDAKSGQDVKIAVQGSVVEAFAESATTQIALPFTVHVNKGPEGWTRKLRFQIRPYGGEKITVTGTHLRMLYWKK